MPFRFWFKFNFCPSKIHFTELKYFANRKKQLFVRFFEKFWYESTRKNLEYDNLRGDLLDKMNRKCAIVF